MAKIYRDPFPFAPNLSPPRSAAHAVAAPARTRTLRAHRQEPRTMPPASLDPTASGTAKTFWICRTRRRPARNRHPPCPAARLRTSRLAAAAAAATLATATLAHSPAPSVRRAHNHRPCRIGWVGVRFRATRELLPFFVLSRAAGNFYLFAGNYRPKLLRWSAHMTFISFLCKEH